MHKGEDLDCKVMPIMIRHLNILKYFSFVITLCMKLSWFCHTNRGHLFCNCPLFEIALVPGLFLAENQTRRVVILLFLQNGWKLSQSICSAGRNTTT